MRNDFRTAIPIPLIVGLSNNRTVSPPPPLGLKSKFRYDTHSVFLKGQEGWSVYKGLDSYTNLSTQDSVCTLRRICSHDGFFS